MMINLKKSIYDPIKAEYTELLLSNLTSRYETELEKNSTNQFFQKINKPMLKELLTGEIVNNSKYVFIEYYRKASILANYLISDNRLKRLWQYVESGDDSHYRRLSKEEFYVKIRTDLVQKYNTPFISPIIDRHSNCYESISEFEAMQIEIRDFLKDINLVSKRIFDYSLIKTDLRAKILGTTKINVCPYCNRQFINTYEIENESTRIIAQLDHFFPKESFPLFALSLYNFIPTCSHCNTILKRNKIFDSGYPINDQANGDLFFDVHIANYKQAIGLEKPIINFVKQEISDLNSLCLIDLYEQFCLKSLYENHAEFVQWLRWKSNLYNDNYKKDLESLMGNKIEHGFKLFLFGYDGFEDELLTKPLSKLAHDAMPKSIL